MHKILDTFPTDPALVGSSFTSILLQRLSSVLFALPPDLLSTDSIRHIGRYKIYVEDALPVLTLLCVADFSACITTDQAPTSPLEDPGYDHEEFSGFLVRNKKQKKPKRKNKTTTSAINMAPFHQLGAKVPSSNAEASLMAREISGEFKMILKVCPRFSQFQIRRLTHL